MKDKLDDIQNKQIPPTNVNQEFKGNEMEMMKFTLNGVKNRVDLLINTYTEDFYYTLKDSIKEVRNLKSDLKVVDVKLTRTAMQYELE